MDDAQFWERVSHQIGQASGRNFQGKPGRSVGGGCINRADRLVDRTDDRAYFVKQNKANMIDMFETEAAGLLDISNTGTIRVPTPICWGVVSERAFLALEWLELGHNGSPALFGKQLAALHACRLSKRFGWNRNNFIGATRQVNTRNEDWCDFFTRERLDVQVKLAEKRGATVARYAELRRTLPELLGEHRPFPSLVHGDLWSGNASFTSVDEPVIYDVAAYFGDREVDLAMSELFGGFPREFYQAYRAALPLDPGYERRRTLYNLYHVFNHYNLFGGFYLSQANGMIAELLSR